MKNPEENKAAELTESDKIWDEVRGMQLDLFALPDQTVEKHCARATVEPSALYLVIKVSAVLPALETSLAKFDIEQVGKWVKVSRKK